MPFTSWSNAIKLRACRYLLHRYLGQFLQEKLTLDQLSIEIASKSSARISDLNLDVVALNRALDDVKLPFEVLDGFIGSVSLVLPLSTIFSDSTELEISQLEVTLRPKSSKTGKLDDEFALDSMLESMTMSTMDLAEQCMKNVENVTETFDEVDTGVAVADKQIGAEMFAGVEKFAQAVDVVLGRTKVCFLDTVFRIEHVYDNARKHGIATEIRIKRIDYRDESLGDETQSQNVKSGLVLGDTVRKRFTIEGIEIFSDQFSDKSMSLSSMPLKSSELHADGSESIIKSANEPEIFKSAIDMSASESAESTSNGSTRRVSSQVDIGLPPSMTTSFSRLATGLSSRLTKMVVIGSKCHVHVTLQNALVASTGSANAAQNTHKMRVQLAVDVSSVYAVLWPNQLHALQMLLDAFLGTGASAKLADQISTAAGTKLSAAEAVGSQRPLTDGDYGRIEAELRRQFNQRHQDVVSGALQHANEAVAVGGNRLGRDKWAGSDGVPTSADGGDDAELLQQYFTMDAARRAGKTSSSKNGAKSADSHATTAAVGTTVAAGARTDVRLKVNSLVLLIHEYDEWIDGKILGLVDFKKQDEKTNSFFDAVADNTSPSFANQASDDKRSKIAALCDSNHLLMLCSPLIVELTSDKRPSSSSQPPSSSSSRRNVTAHQSIAQHFDLVVYLSANNVNIWEHIYSSLGQNRVNTENDESLLRLNTFPICSTLLSFPRLRKSSTGDVELLYGSDSEPCVVLQLRAQTSTFEKSSQPNILVNIQLASFASDVDLSLIDRLHVLLNPKSTLQHNSTQIYDDAVNDRNSRRNSSGSARSAASKSKDNHVSLQISAPLATIRLKIPVYDGRASPLEKILDENRLKSVHLHPQMLVLELERLTFNIVLPTQQQTTVSSFAVACGAGKLLFQPDAAGEPVPLAWLSQTSSNANSSVSQSAIDNSRQQPCELKFTITNPTNFARSGDVGVADSNTEAGEFQNVTYGATRAGNGDLSSASSNNTDDEFYYPPSSSVAPGGGGRRAAKHGARQEPNLFASSRRIVDGEDKGLLYISPSDVDTVEQFQSDACSRAKLLIEVVLPQVYLALPDKPFFELFYNRVFNDLFMWEPLSLIMAKFGLTLEAAVLGRTAAAAANNNLDVMYSSTVTIGNGLAESVHTFREFKRRSSTEWNMPTDIDSNQIDDEDNDDLLAMDSHQTLIRKPSHSSGQKNSPAKNNNNMFYSVHAGGNDVVSGMNEPKLLPIDAVRDMSMNDVAVTVRILQGAVVMRTPVYGGEQDSAENATNSTAPRMHGEVYVQLNNAKIFVVAGYNGQPELQYVFISAQDGGMYSTPRVAESVSQYFHTLSATSWSISPPTTNPAPYLKPVLLPAAALGITKSFDFSSNSKSDLQSLPDILRLAMEINFDPFRNVKDIRLALGIAHVALHHRFIRNISPGIDWLQQLIDFFDIQQYPIEGLSWPTTVTELHVDAIDSCVLYRPLFLPLTSVVFVGRLNISSTLVAEAVSTLLRVVVQDLWVMLSDKTTNKRRQRSASGAVQQLATKSVDLAQDFACVIEVPHFELETRVSNVAKKSTELQRRNSVEDADTENRPQMFDAAKMNVPVIDLKISNSAVHVRSCSDSFQALCDLLQYCANMGDLANDETGGASAAAAAAMENSGSSASNVPSMPVLNADSSKTLSSAVVESSPPSYATAMMTSSSAAMAAPPPPPPPPATAEGIDLQMSDAMQDDYRQQQLSSATGTNSTSSRAVTTTEEESDDFALENEVKNRRHLSKKRPAQPSSMTQSVHPNLGNVRTLNQGPSTLNVPKNSNVLLKNNPMAQSMLVKAPVVPLRKTRSSQHKPHRHHHRNHGDDPMIRSAVTLGDEDFCLIDEDLGAGILPKSGQIAIKRLLDIRNESVAGLPVQIIKVIDNHFAVPTSTAVDQLKAPADFPCPEERVVVHDMNVMFCIYGGSDFADGGEKAVKSSDSGKRMPSLMISELNQAGSATRAAAGAVSSSQILHRSRIPSWLRQGGVGRDHTKLLEIHANKIRFQHDRYPNDAKSKPAARQVLLIKTIEIIDRLQSSSINKFLYQYSTSALPRQTHTNMLEVRALHERPHPDVSPQQECSLKVSLQPLRLNVDQETLLFLRDWGSALGAAAKQSSSSVNNNSNAVPAPQPPASPNNAAVLRRQRTPSSASVSSLAAPNGTVSGGTAAAFDAAACQQQSDTPSPVAGPKRVQSHSRSRNDSFANAAVQPNTGVIDNNNDADEIIVENAERPSSARLLIDLIDASVGESTNRASQNGSAATATGSDGVELTVPLPVIANGGTEAFHAALEASGIEGDDERRLHAQQIISETSEPTIKFSSSSSTLPNSETPFSNTHFVIPIASSSPSTTSNPTFVDGPADAVDGDVADGTPADLNQIYFRSFVFAPEVPIRLDYHGRFRDLVGGGVVGLITGLAQFNFSQLTLKRITHRQGVLGVNRLANVIAREWIEDIRVNQLSSILQGIGPTHSFVQVLQGVRDLFWMPVEQYRRDGRIITGVQRGANAFTTSTLLAVLELTRGAVGIVQRAAECCFDIMCVGGPNQTGSSNAVAGGATSGMTNASQSGMVLVRSNQDQFVNVRLPSNHDPAMLTMQRLPPSDFREGVVTAYEVLRTGMTGYVSDVASQIATEHRDKGLVGAAGVTFRHAQPAVVRTVALVSEAANNMLGGLRNQLQPEARRDDIEKWKFPKDYQQQQQQQQPTMDGAQMNNRKKRGTRRPLTAADLLYSDDEDDEQTEAQL